MLKVSKRIIKKAEGESENYSYTAPPYNHKDEVRAVNFLHKANTHLTQSIAPLTALIEEKLALGGPSIRNKAQDIKELLHDTQENLTKFLSQWGI